AACWPTCAATRTASASPPSAGFADALSLHDPRPDRVDRGLDAVFDLELHQDVRDVVLDRLRADVELTGDHRVVLAVRDQLQHLDLAVGELRLDQLRLAVRRAR